MPMPIFSDIPAPPDESTWGFIDDLRDGAVHPPIDWLPRPAHDDEVELGRGIRLEIRFPDPRGVLETAYADFRNFLRTADIAEDGAFPLVIEQRATTVFEEYDLDITPTGCCLLANDTEGIRRGLVWLEDAMLQRGGAFLPLGAVRRTPVQRIRLSRCFYGPINRPPRHLEELANEVDYYPDGYLNRLAHHGINALWLTIDLFTLVPSTIIPEYGRDGARRLAKLRRVVEQCARYGIRIIPFCIEPAGFSRPHAELKAAMAAHPDLVGHAGAFCTSTEKGKAYLHEAMHNLFSAVPGLGGLLVISVGERQTHCASVSFEAPGCPRCKDRSGYDILADTLTAFAEGMHAVAPDAVLISWPYSQCPTWGYDRSVEAAKRVPPGVALQQNFETGGWNTQLGVKRPLWDYWLSVVGPADMFRDCAVNARQAGTPMFAKLQVSCSHEICTTSYLPIPGLIYDKFMAMRKLGVSGVMFSWLTGAYPCVMSKAAGELSFSPTPRGKQAFLRQLAQQDWGEHSEQVRAAWMHFETGYLNYPSSHMFQYYGPVNDGVVWPLHLIPRRLPLSPFWQLPYPPSGDDLPMCLPYAFTFAEIRTLCRRMDRHWRKGAAIMQALLPLFTQNPDRLRDIRVSLAVGYQITAAANILEFYHLREQLCETTPRPRRAALLRKMRAIVELEMSNGRALLALSEQESLLGYQSEAEGYKYYPDRLRWRLAQLQRLLAEEFPTVEARFDDPTPLFPAYTGEAPTEKVYHCARVATAPMRNGQPVSAVWDALPWAECSQVLERTFEQERWRRCGYDPHNHTPAEHLVQPGFGVRWSACHDGNTLFLQFRCAYDPENSNWSWWQALHIDLEPQRMEPRLQFRFGSPNSAECVRDGATYITYSDNPWRVYFTEEKPREWSVMLELPLAWLMRREVVPERIRFNVMRQLQLSGHDLFWHWQPVQPAQGRLMWDYLNPATDFGWLRLEP